MKETIRYGFILAVICVVAAGLLAGVNLLTKDKIISQAQAEEAQSLKEVIAQAVFFEPVKEADEILYYRALDSEKKFIGVAFKAKGKGYSSTIETIAGMSKDGRINAIKVLSQNETPGLGARVTETSFTQQFSGKRDLGDIQAITGATISSRAVIDSIEKKKAEIERLIKNER